MSSGDKFNLKEAMGIFFTESREMLEDFEGCLLSLEKDMEDEESIHALFRAAHTIKGSSGMFGFNEIEKFTHAVENMLDDVRNATLKLSPEMINLLFECHDYIGQLISLYEQGDTVELSGDLVNKRDELLETVNKHKSEGKEEPVAVQEVPEAEVFDIPEDDFAVASPYWHISLRFNEDILKNGLDPQSFISYLNEVGNIEQVLTIAPDSVSLEDIDPELCYLGFEILFDGDTTKEVIEDVFDFLLDDCELRIVSPGSSIGEYVNLLNELPEKPMHIGEMLMEVGSLTKAELERALEMQKEFAEQELDDLEIEGAEEKKLIGEIMVEEQMVQRPVLNAALERQQDIKKNEEQRKKSIRVDALKLDSLINLIGELVITGASVKQLAEKEDNPELIEVVSTLSRLVEDVRDSTMNIRMVPIGETFKRYERVVRDLSKDRGKKINLIVSGGDTELDKTLIEKIADPMMHLIRNAADHGIGTPGERRAQGKPETGTIHLNSYGETGSIVIEVADDGNGLNREKIYNKAVSKGLIDEGEEISDDDLFQFIFEPGFSTAEVITNISGRGVGMDVVRKNIESLRGQIEIESEEGVGTTIRIYMPLTLAIIDGFMVEVGGVYYILPLDMVVECNEISEEELKGKEAGNYMDLRGEVLPFMSLRDFFKVEGERPKRSNVIVTEYGRKKAGLVVDRPIGEVQTVIKPMGKVFENMKWASGATILGTGEVAIILDVPMLIHHVQGKETEKSHAKAGTVV